MRRAAKVDANQAEIVTALRNAGYSVWVTSALGHGFPDLLVGKGRCNWLLEVKDGKKPPSQRRLTPDEMFWHNTWRGQVAVIESVEDAFSIVQKEMVR